MICIVSSYMYACIAAFGIPEPGSEANYVVISFEVIFVLDMLVCKFSHSIMIFKFLIVEFILEYKPEDQYNKVRDLTKIAKRYLKTRFLLDLIAIIPFDKMLKESNTQRKLCYVIKIIRIQKGYHLLSSNTFMRQVKDLFKKRLERIIRSDPELAENSDLDNNNIMVILMISYFFKTFKLVVIILTVSYFMGMFWYIYCDLTFIEDPVD